MNWLKILAGFGFLFLLTLSACKTADNSMMDYVRLEELVENRNFQVTNNWAVPFRGSQINISNNDNIILFKGDSVRLFLPYYGERQMGGGYNEVLGFEYNGLLQQLEIKKEPAENRIKISFQTDESTETIWYDLTLYTGSRSLLRVNSNQRDYINYRGTYEPVRE